MSRGIGEVVVKDRVLDGGEPRGIWRARARYSPRPRATGTSAVQESIAEEVRIRHVRIKALVPQL